MNRYSVNMVNTAGCYNINTGGRVNSFDSSIKGEDGKWRPTTKDDYQNDRGTTREVVYKESPEQNWECKEREMTDRARTYFPNVRESVLERELWNQVTGDNRTVPNVSPRLAVEYRAYQARLTREDVLSQQLLEQINAR